MSVPKFLKVKLGDTVLVGEDEIANVLSFIEGARDPVSPNPSKSQTLIQAKSNLFHSEEVKQILSKHE